MKNSKIWVILGATDGLGPPAIKYLLLNQQRVIALFINSSAAQDNYKSVSGKLHVIHINVFDLRSFRKEMQNITIQYGLVDFIINNSNYRLFNNLGHKGYTQINNSISESVAETIVLLKELLPFFRKHPTGNLVNIPPQLCLATVKKADAEVLLSAMGMFLTALHNELQSLNCPFTFLEPGDRLSDLAV
ncbi:SDR family NAD(P)-dependent oxidoreductase [Mucilaginibacter sp. E4BP6]|uniref:SDR family NAD(P)-dependent oxidoreductase n=1 Tax=Mucilaginibacter sp. E4BP6 TaxID=2723089 RepID=UPI0015C897DC|nr:SDR family NAD(P)-dependent oxidoreductase [Mucilaginibacter sp. E4BP6]NYE68171.1 NADP-dependent 3-hydroxy acid dehydrogenase YdfG [Mucilaginibacter sp. E4BP6]